MQDWLVYQNQNATRNDPLDPRLVSALSFLPEMGIQMHVVSGGQEPAGAGGTRTGSTRHDHGMAADADFYMGGRKLDWNNPNDLPILVDLVKRAKSAGVTGIGAGDDYMGAGRFHVGFGNPGVWGADGKGTNAPDWLRAAYEGAPLPESPYAAPPSSAAPTNALAGAVAPQQAPQNALAPQLPDPFQMVDMRQDPRAYMNPNTGRNALAMRG